MLSMPNIGTILKTEISRVSKRDIRAQLRPIQAASSAHRKQLAALKKQVQQLERQLAALMRGSKKTNPAAEVEEEAKFRFTAKGLRSLRGRLGLSAADFGRLLQVGGQTIYNWENGKTSPRRAQVPVIAGLRKLGKRELKVRLEALGDGG